MVRFFKSLRFRLILLVMVALMPTVGVIIYNTMAARREATAVAQDHLQRLVALVAREQAQKAMAARHFLLNLALNPAVGRRDAAACNALFQWLQSQPSSYLNVGAVDPEANVFASALPMSGPVNAADKEWFQLARSTRDFAVGKLMLGRIALKPVTVYGYPVLDQAGAIQAVVFASIGMDWLTDLAAEAKLPPGSVLTIIDDQGTIMAKYPDPGKWAGKSLPPGGLIDLIRKTGQGVAEARGMDGEPRLFAFRPLDRTQQSGFVFAGIPTRVVYAVADQALRRNLAVLGGVLLLALVFAWGFGYLLIMRRINPLMQATARLATGDLAARTGLAAGPEELGQLAQAFDQMAAALEEREAERQRVETELRESKRQALLLADLLELSSQPFGIGFPDGRVGICNTAFRRLLGYSKEELCALHWGKDLTPPEWLEKEGAILAELHRTGQPVRYEKEYWRKDGTRVPVELLVHVHLDEQGEPAYYYAFIADITERQRAEKALRESEELYRSLFENMLNGFAYCKMLFEDNQPQDFIYLSVNRSFEALTGLKNVEGKRVSEVIPGIRESDPKLLATYGRVALTGIPERFETYVESMQMWFHISVYSPEKEYFVAVFDVITERKQAEAALRESENRYRELVRNANSAIIRWKCDGTITFFNEYAQDFFGYRSEEVLGRHVSILMPERESTGGDLTGLIQNILEHPERYLNNVNENICRDGRRAWMVWTNKPILDDDGQVLEILAIGSDITERQRAEEALQASEAQYRLLAENVIDVIWTMDLNWKFTYASPSCESLSGYKDTEIVGMTLDQLLTPESTDLCKKTLAILLSPENLARREYPSFTLPQLELRCKDGSKKVYIEVKGSFLKDSQQQPMGIVGVTRDISERKQWEEQFLQVQKMEAVGTLAGGIAHDFNNILTSILGNIGLAALDKGISPPVQDRLAQAEAACLRAEALSRQLLTFATGGAPVKKLFPVPGLLTETALFACVGSPVKCATAFPENLWSIEADPGQIGQVFQNLTINAIQAMPTGGTIEVWAENLTVGTQSDLPLSAGKYIKISMRDQGTGIPAEHLPRIFDPYFTTKHKGSGLGLASAYAIIKNHHGHIAVESKPGVGTTFTIYLPAVERPVTPPAQEDRELLVGTGKILLMDDEEMVREVVGRMLAKLGYEPEFAGDGDEAIKKFVQAQGSGQAFAGVILDLTVPGAMGGKQTMARLLEIDPQIKAIVSSGYSDDPIMADFQKYGFSGIIAKPYKISELGKILKKVIMEKA